MPNLHADTISKTDRLDRQAFARGIARLLVLSAPDENESLVFGLNGRWGSGKSTLLHFVKDEIKTLHEDRDGAFVVIEFNPWMFSGQEQLLEAFYDSLSRKITAEKENLAQKAGRRIADWLEESKVGRAFGSLFSDQIEKGKKSIKHLLGEGGLEDSKNKLGEALVAENVRLYVIMDDLDRLAPDEIAQVFQLVKLNANFKNTTFLLAYDKDVVVAALEQKFKGQGERYLAKIVQADYTLPEMLEEQVENLFFEELEKRLASLKVDFDWRELMPFWQKHGLKNYFKTPRDIHRYLNGLMFRLPEVWREVNVAHFLIVEAVRIFDFEGYEKLYEISLNCRRKTLHFPTFKDDDIWTKDQFEQNKTTLELIRAMQKSRIGSLKEMRVDVQNDLFSDDAFERYFSLRLSKKDMPELEFRGFLDNPGEERERLLVIWKNGRFENFLRRLVTPGWEKESPNVGLSAVEGLISFFDGLDENQQNAGFFSLLEGFIELLKKQKPALFEPIQKSMMSIQGSYPHSTRFKLLFLQWLDFQKLMEENPSIEPSSERKKVIKCIRDYAESWADSAIKNVDRSDCRFEHNHLILRTLAGLEPLIYPDFILKNAKGFEQVAWLIAQQCFFDDAEKAVRFRPDSALFPPVVLEHIKRLLTAQPLETMKDRLRPRHFEAVKFFLDPLA